jgi:DNA-binding Lrp family transcriptional regulator
MLTELEKKIVSLIQGDIAITQRPYLEIAEKLGIPEEVLLDTLKDLCKRGVMRRFGVN